MDPETVNEVCEKYFWELRVGEDFHGDEDGKIRYSGKRFSMMGADYFMAEIIDSLEELYSGAAGGIIRETGTEYGRELLDAADEAKDEDTYFGRFLALLQFLGYSKIKVTDEQIRVEASPTAVEHRKMGKEERKTCFFLSGLLTGAFQDIYGSDQRLVEQRCRADGDEVCSFQFQEAVESDQD